MIFDKRKLKRYDVFLIVEFKPLKSPGGFSIGITRDLSSDGFSLESQTIECQRGDIMEFRLKHPDAEWTVDISGEVTWRNHSWYKYVIGIKFINVTEEQNLNILKLMSAVIDAENKLQMIGTGSEGLLGTEKGKMPDARMGEVAIDKSISETRMTRIDHISLNKTEQCELTGAERTFVAGDVFDSSRAKTDKILKSARDNNNSENKFKETLLKEKGIKPETRQMPIDGKAADGKTRKDKEAEAEHVQSNAARLSTTHSQHTTQAPYLYNVDPLGNNRKKRIWLYIPFALMVIIISVIAYPGMKKIFNHSSDDFLTVSKESAENNSLGRDGNSSARYNVQMDIENFNGQSGPSPDQQTEAKVTFPSVKDQAASVQQTSVREDLSGIPTQKSVVIPELKSKNNWGDAPPSEIDKTINNLSQKNNANIFKSETDIGTKPLQDDKERNNKISLIAKIDETLKVVRSLQNEKPGESEVVIDTVKTNEYKPIVKTEEQPPTQQVVKLEETPPPAAFSDDERIPAAAQGVKVYEGEKEDIKKTEPAVKKREIPNVALFVKRDNPKNAQNTPSDITAVTTADLIKKWKHIGSTVSGVPLFIAPENISYPYQNVVNLLVKATVNKKVFIDMLAINCSQNKLRILEERNGNNPAFSYYSNEWKDITPDSMILYNFACPEKK